MSEPFNQLNVRPTSSAAFTSVYAAKIQPRGLKNREITIFSLLVLALHVLAIYPLLHRQHEPLIQVAQPSPSSMAVELTREPVPPAETPVAEAPATPPQTDEFANKPRPETPLPKAAPQASSSPPAHKPVVKKVEKLPTHPVQKTAQKKTEKPVMKTVTTTSEIQTARTSTSGHSSTAKTAPASFSAATAAGYRSNPAPEYPSLALRRHWEGTVVLRVRVLTSGQPGEIQIQASSGKSVLDQSALAAVRQWQFEPAKRGGIAEEGWVSVPLNFKLQ